MKSHDRLFCINGPLCRKSPRTPFINMDWRLIPLWMNSYIYIYYKVWDKITYPFPNFNCAAVEVWEWMSNFISHFIGNVIAYPCWALVRQTASPNGEPVMWFSYCWLNTLRLRQNGCHLADAIFKCIFLNENVWISVKISLKFFPKVQINNIPALVQMISWCRPGDKPLSQPMVISLQTHMCHSASMS